MKEKKKIGFESLGYVAPRAEGVPVCQESILCASQVHGVSTTNYNNGPTMNW